MRARYYNPEIKRFMNQDVLRGGIVDSTSLNRYSYVNGNPVSYIDPFGLSKETEEQSGSDSNWEITEEDAKDFLFDLLGFVPVFGDYFDIINGLRYLEKGDKFNAVVCFSSALFIVGDVVGKGTKYTLEALHKAGKTDDIVRYASSVKGLKIDPDVFKATGDIAKSVDNTVDVVKSSTNYLELLNNLDDNKINHIINGSKRTNHCWEKLVPDKNWNDIKNIIAEVLDKGTESTYKTIYSKKFAFDKYEVEVAYVKLGNGEIAISNAWVK